MTVEEFQSATADHLREKANDSFVKADQSGSLDRPGFLMEAQFYLAEIERREQQKERVESARIARRDFWMEIAVIVLIGIEIGIGFIGVFAGASEAGKQITALNSLNQSTSRTASNISRLTEAQTELTTAQKNTLNALQDQLEILRQQQKQRLAELTKQPDIGMRWHIREITPTSAKYQITVENSSEVAARDFVVYFEAGAQGVTLVIPDSGSNSPSRTSVYIPLLGAGLKQTVSLNAQYPAGAAPFRIRIFTSGENISAKTLGDLFVKPPVR